MFIAKYSGGILTHITCTPRGMYRKTVILSQSYSYHYPYIGRKEFSKKKDNDNQ